MVCFCQMLSYTGTAIVLASTTLYITAILLSRIYIIMLKYKQQKRMPKCTSISCSTHHLFQCILASARCMSWSQLHTTLLVPSWMVHGSQLNLKKKSSGSRYALHPDLGFHAFHSIYVYFFFLFTPFWFEHLRQNNNSPIAHLFVWFAWQDKLPDVLWQDALYKCTLVAHSGGNQGIL